MLRKILAAILLGFAIFLCDSFFANLTCSSKGELPSQVNEPEEVECEPEKQAEEFRLANPVCLQGIEMEALVTAYAPGDEGVGEITRYGLPVDRGVVAVDPEMIPPGSVVYVPGYGYAIAADTGGLVKGRRIDVYLASRSDALEWGAKRLRVIVYSAN